MIFWFLFVLFFFLKIYVVYILMNFYFWKK